MHLHIVRVSQKLGDKTQLRWLLAMGRLMQLTMVLLFHSTWLFVCERYAVVVRCFKPKWLHSDLKNLLQNWLLVSVIRYASIPFGMTDALKKIFAAVFMGTRAAEAARISSQ